MTNRCRTLLSCTLCYGLALFFMAAGLAKLAAPAAAQRTFTNWGFPDWFHLLVGSLEIIGAAMLVFGPTTTFAAALLGGMMLGAVATHLVHQEFAPALLPGALVLPIACVGFCRRLDAAWMRRLKRRELGAGATPGLAAAPDDHSIVPGVPELRIAQDSRQADLPDAPDPLHQRRA